jgi:hypothetical protein
MMARDGFLVRKLITHIDSDIQDKIIAVSRILQTVLLYVLILRNEKYSSPDACEMERLLDVNHHLQATDPRDKIYGFLALAENHSIQPDYSKTTQQVYTEAARSMLPHCPELLVYGGTSTRKNAMNLSIASSWAPDWDWITRSATTIATAWKALVLLPSSAKKSYGSPKFQFKHLPDVEVLRLRGQICHTVVNSKSYTEWLEPECLGVTIRSMYNHSYPQWRQDGRLQEPMQRLVALYCIFTQRIVTTG